MFLHYLYELLWKYYIETMKELLCKIIDTWNASTVYMVLFFAKLPKCQVLKILHATHFLKLLDKMYRYEIDPTWILGATERTKVRGIRTKTCGLDHMFLPGPTFIKTDQLHPWIKAQLKSLSCLQFRFHSYQILCNVGKKPFHMTQNFVTVEAKLWTAEHFLVDHWLADLV